MDELTHPCPECGEGLMKSIAALLERSDVDGCPRCNRQEIIQADVRPAEGFDPWATARSR